MTRTANARLAGSTLLLYFATGIASMVLYGQAVAGEGTAAKLAGMAHHATLVRVTILLSLLQAVYPLVLGVTLYALTRDTDPDLALMALWCRAGEGLIAALSPLRTLGLLAIATSGAAGGGADAAAEQALAAFLLKTGGWTGLVAATCFAVASTLFSYLFLRARSIPVALAWLGVLASALWVVALPLQLAGFLGGSVTYLLWMPMAVFEVTFALWLLAKGVTPPGITSPSGAP
jgi:hypothetical protein